ncbi:hypothetical protein IJ556_05460, partial [bacterium]|nr:hypothetical protein [bacterium]
MAIVSVCFCMNLFNIIYFKHTALEFTVEQVEVSPLTHVDAYHYLSMSASDNYRVGMRFSPSERKKMNESVDAYTEITVKGTLKNTQGRSLRRITNAFNYNGLDYLYSDAKVYCEHVSCSDAITLAAGESTEYSVVIIVSAENTKIEPRIELFVTKENQQNFGITVYGRQR